MKSLICLTALIVVMGGAANGNELLPMALESFDYPLLGVQAQIAGDVEIDVTVRRTGEVVATRVISGHRVLATAAVTAIRNWRFAYRCADRNVPEETTVRFVFTFRLEGVVDGRPRTKLRYTFPNRVTITGEAVYFQPARQGGARD